MKGNLVKLDLTGQDPANSSPGGANKNALAILISNVESLLEWSKLVDDRLQAYAISYTLSHDHMIEIVSTLESLCRILIEDGLVSRERLDDYRDEYVKYMNESFKSDLKGKKAIKKGLSK